MKEQEISYQELQAELAEVKAVITALRRGEVDAIIGKDNVLVVRLIEVEAALRREKDFLQKLYNAIADAIITVKLPGRIIEQVNNSVERIFGYKPEEFLGKGGEIIYANREEYLRISEKIKDALEQGIDIVYSEHYFRKKNGDIFPGDITISFIKENNRPVRAIGVVRDITERKRDEEELQRYRGQLEELVEERTAELKAANEQLLHAEKLAILGGLAASIAHEFRSPVFGIQMVLQEIKEKASLKKSEQKLISLAINENHRMSKMLLNLKDLYRPSTDTSAPSDIHQIIEEALEIYRKKLQISKVKVVKNFAENMPKVPIVADHIKQVFLNFIINAEEEMSASGGFLTIQTRVLGEKVQISLRDTGHGIAKDKLNKIFEPFFTTKLSKGGTGLGLAVSYGIIKNHGGNILVESAPNEGSIFTVELPVTGAKEI